jgi:pimeloyl-ACP methyl ester carboxylesterase
MSFGGTDLSELIQGLGFAFAATSYRRNGLVVLDALDDVRELVETFHQAHGPPRGAYLVGASEGALITTLLLERQPGLFDGGLAACGPIGDFLGQVHYVADFRVLFDYFFPGVIPGSPLSVPSEVMEEWSSRYAPAVARALAGDEEATRELMAVSGVRPRSATASDVQAAVLNVLWYSVLAINDAIHAFGGNPYDNQVRQYSGSMDDEQLNRDVQRFSAKPDALAEVSRYESSGLPTVPLVAIHTVGDEVIPYWHMERYRDKVDPSDRGLLQQITIQRSGHCNFTPLEILAATRLLIQRATEATPTGGR